MDLLEKTFLSSWWAETKDHYRPDEAVRILKENREFLKVYFLKLKRKNYLYRISDRMFSIFSRIAEVADLASESIQRLLMRLSILKRTIKKGRDWKNHLNFKEMVEFGRTKLHSFRRYPHNEKAISIAEEIIEFASRHGYDINAIIPNARQIFLEKKHQLLQHKFFQEFSKSRLEQILAVRFQFDRNIFPVLPDSAFWHRIFEGLEKRKVIDILLVNHDSKRFSFKKDSPADIASSDVIRILKKLTDIKNNGRRIFFIGHHEGYLGPYFVRSVIRKLGFDALTGNCNTVVGPRMFSNIVLRNGAANAGNLFIAVPSQKTTGIKTSGLAEELRKTARRTQCLVKMPDAGLRLIEQLEYGDFMDAVHSRSTEQFKSIVSFLDSEEIASLEEFLAAEDFSEAMKDFHEEDYRLFKRIMRESFLLFPEGSRSYIDADGAVVLKYINPKYLQAYMRPGDYIAPVSLVGGSDIARGWHLRPAKLGISMGQPVEVTAKMLDNYEEEGLKIMQGIALLPNIKTVRYKEAIQFKRKTQEQ